MTLYERGHSRVHSFSEMVKSSNRLVAAAFALALGCGSGSGQGPSVSPSPIVATPSPGSPTPTPDPSHIVCEDAFEEGEVFLAVAQIYGVAPSNGIPSTKRVLIRTHRGEAEVLDFVGDNQPEWRGPIFFSSPEVAWSWSQGDTNVVLLRSGDAGITWQRVSSIPQGGNRRLDLHVDEQRELAVALLVYEGRGSFGTPGPFVYRSTRLGTDDWQQADVPLPEFLQPVWFGLGARGGRIEVPRRWPGLEIYDVTGEVVATPVELDETFQPSEYATFDDRGWIGGTFVPESADDFVPAVLASGADGEWQLVPVDGVARGRVAVLDFATAEQGITCGADFIAPHSADFCAFSDDGGRSWTRGALPADGLYFVRGVARSRCGAGAVAVSYSFKEPPVAVLTSDDGGRGWSEQLLPRLADRLDIGPLTRNSRPGESTASVVVAPAAPLELPEPAAPIAPQAPGPIVWAAGDTIERGATIMGLLLRSEVAGESWTPVLGVPGGSLSSVDFVDRRYGWVVGAGRILRTVDGGATFVDQTGGVALEAPPRQTRIVSAGDAERAIVVATGRPAGVEFDHDVLLVTGDAGDSWRLATLPDFEIVGAPRLGDACLAGGGAGILMAETRVLLTRDGGETWDFVPDFPSFFRGEPPAFYCSGREDLWIVGSNVDPGPVTLWHSPDGGRTWRDLSEAVGAPPEGGRPVASFLASGSGWIVLPRRGETPQVLRTQDGGASWAALASPFLDGELPVAIAFSDDRHGVLLTSQRRALDTVDGGETWAETPAPADFAPLALSVAP